MRLLCFAICCVLPFLSSCAEPDPVPLEPRHEVVDVRVHTLKAGAWQRQFKSYGLVVPAQEYEISVAVNAPVEEVLFKEGQAVKAGDVLLRLDDEKLRLRLQGAQANMDSARAAHEQARSTHARNESIYKTGVISEQAYVASEANLKSTRAQLAQTRSAYDIAREELADAELYSPVTGVVTQRNIEPGKNASPMDRLGIIRVRDALRIETFVSQKDINLLRVGMPAQVSSPAAPGVLFSGRIDSLASAAEARTGNFEVGVIVEDSGGLLRDGMSAMVLFEGAPEEGVISVPRRALVDRNRRLMVFRVVDDIAQAVEPVVGIASGDMLPVLHGLSAGDDIVVSNLRLVTDGQRLRRIEPPAAEG